jgi:hypothetical protein
LCLSKKKIGGAFEMEKSMRLRHKRVMYRL